jgi:effector-binding domain-containing protein
MGHHIATHHVEPQAIVSIRDRRPLARLPGFIKTAIPEILGRLRILGATPAGPPFVIYHEFGSQGIDAEVSVPVVRQVMATGRIRSRVLPAMTLARTVHVGPYEQLGDAYAALTDWIKGHGFEVAGPVEERYLNGPGDHVPSSEYQTEIEMPIVEQVVAAPV